MAAYDPVHDLFVVTAFRNGTAGVRRRPRQPVRHRRVQLKEGGTAAGQAVSARLGVVAGTQGVPVLAQRRRRLRVQGWPSGDWKTGTWQWSKLTSGSNSAHAASMSVDNGIYSRFRIARYQNAEVAVVVNDVNGSGVCVPHSDDADDLAEAADRRHRELDPDHTFRRTLPGTADARVSRPKVMLRPAGGSPRIAGHGPPPATAGAAPVRFVSRPERIRAAVHARRKRVGQLARVLPRALCRFGRRSQLGVHLACAAGPDRHVGAAAWATLGTPCTTLRCPDLHSARTGGSQR